MNHIGRETYVEVEGRKYRLSRFTRKLVSAFLDWSEAVLPNPFDAIKGKLDGLPEFAQQLIVKDAIEAAKLRKSLNSPEVQALMGTDKGLMKIICLLFSTHHPELTVEDASKIYDDCLEEHGADYLPKKIAEASGIVLAKGGEGEGDFRKE